MKQQVLNEIVWGERNFLLSPLMDATAEDKNSKVRREVVDGRGMVRWVSKGEHHPKHQIAVFKVGLWAKDSLNKIKDQGG